MRRLSDLSSTELQAVLAANDRAMDEFVSLTDETTEGLAKNQEETSTIMDEEFERVLSQLRDRRK